MSEQEPTLEDFQSEAEEEPAEAEERETSESRFWGAVPEDWELRDGSEIYDVNPNPDPDEDVNTYIEMDALDTELPWPRYFGERDASEYSGKTFTEGDTLFARITPCTENGKAALVPEMESRVGIGSTEFAVLSPDRSEVLPWYLYYVAKSYPVHNYAISRMRGSTGRQRVPFSVFRQEIDFALPPEAEQRKIATVLHNVDMTIKKTSEIESQLARVKKGVVQDLFTYGLRGSETQDKRFGEFPDYWSFDSAANVATIERGSTPRTENDEYYGGDITWVTPDDLSELNEEGNGKYITESGRTLTEEGLESASLNVVGADSVMFTSRSYGIGRTALCTVPAAMNQGITALECGDPMDPEFLYYYLNYIMDYVVSISGGSTFPEISKSAVENLEVPVPEKSEQEEIGEVLSSIDQQIRHNHRVKEQLTRLKTALMQDLLTGEVRTHEKPIEVPETITAHD